MKLKSRLRYYIRTGCWIEGKEERIDEVVNIADITFLALDSRELTVYANLSLNKV